MNQTRKVRIATRGSQLALWQANHVSSLLQARGLNTELNIIKTTGDRVQDRFLHEIGGKGLFVRELEEAMKGGTADIAVHSLKDLPARIPAGFQLAAILPRHIPQDALIFNPKSLARLKVPEQKFLSKADLKNMGPMTIATASLRRQSLLKGLGPQINLVPVRGNVDTRIRKLNEGDWDGLILAGASLERLSLDHLPHRLLADEWYVPCAAQGALTIETPADSPFTKDLAALSDATTYACATMERMILEKLGGDCTMPFGAFFFPDVKKGETIARALVLDYEGQEARYVHTFKGLPDTLDYEASAKTMLDGLKKVGVTDILHALKIKAPILGDLA
ncbi:MAG TPA: hydroxymethylbilane synthase [Oligoflexus sp.]|uniref:hydroxymethylbilane synthase n=1 Tax=Oligoflexus sp. TaxID=1971216 RepID=UPI002D80146B|nr:hydroxymethylbilane synthase [Oligoflexus sp.]HET9237382.1 hydroxymethylbilane synthase [Oligoflexus sp.]